MRGLFHYLDQFGDKQLRVVSEFNLHITLRFLGEVEATRLTRLNEILLQQVETSQEFELDLIGLGFFSNSMWLSVATSPALTALAERINLLLVKQGFTAERRVYKPHVTVARFRKGTKINLPKMQNSYAGAEWGTLAVREFHLYKSETFPQGARYTILNTFPV